uniref:ATP synthase F0 subunit 8 n=1 Tax=Pseudacysta perseae TaxID=1041453 RepID=A0A089QM33_PSEPZ|nr:ATP synthase F0 subunit 8 [Pseudacysta perseae]AIR11944.1 ATP synthase F0 subunit 8 [Pseudacysta perseae]
MPQMAPMWWMYMYLVSLLILLLMMMMLYFEKKNVKNTITSNTIFKKKLNWMW